ncbi:sensor histidine kinase [Novosphingobium sp. 9U]|uniref:sensor histidine kinase n=1 Tax=Novosphingobium sp. 9U TaxID=2653158 RepID=UPI0012F276C9|nr:sensor histidine kinase [Novosphingobium sp. 9U]VWX55002.1 conserved membrane hypothetical protein [Novosphingobium sp. 9U]
MSRRVAWSLAYFDAGEGLQSPQARTFARLLFGVTCGLGMIALCMAIDLWAPGAGAFALVYPAVLLATLYGHWKAGLLAYLVSFGWALLQVLPLAPDAPIASEQALARVGLHALAALVVLLFAETFRGAVAHERAQREAEIERRAVLLAELEHRTKNNFALVASLLELQKRREDSEQVARAFNDAIGRVRTFAEAYTHLVGEQGEGVVVEMRPYLERLVARASSAMLPPQVLIKAHVADVSLPREVAVAIGLFANEALTNCAKYAFPQGRGGTIEIDFVIVGAGWQLSVRDDGVGHAAPTTGGSGGIGTQLLEAFAHQARAVQSTRFSAEGCEVSLTCERHEA